MNRRGFLMGSAAAITAPAVPAPADGYYQTPEWVVSKWVDDGLAGRVLYARTMANAAMDVWFNVPAAQVHAPASHIMREAAECAWLNNALSTPRGLL